MTTPQSPTIGQFHPGKEADQRMAQVKPNAGPAGSGTANIAERGPDAYPGPRSMFRTVRAGAAFGAGDPAAWNHETPGDAGGLECVCADVGL